MQGYSSESQPRRQPASETVRNTANAVHGAGEAIRGNFNAMIDRSAHDKRGEAKNQAVADHGIEKINRARPHDTNQMPPNQDTYARQQPPYAHEAPPSYSTGTGEPSYGAQPTHMPNQSHHGGPSYGPSTGGPGYGHEPTYPPGQAHHGGGGGYPEPTMSGGNGGYPGSAMHGSAAGHHAQTEEAPQPPPRPPRHQHGGEADYYYQGGQAASQSHVTGPYGSHTAPSYPQDSYGYSGGSVKPHGSIPERHGAHEKHSKYSTHPQTAPSHPEDGYGYSGGSVQPHESEQYGASGTHSQHSTRPPHKSNIMNKLDPRIDDREARPRRHSDPRRY